LADPHRLRDDERGATAVIVVLSLLALFGLIVLTVDVGQLLFQRRGMVNASDAAALAAAQTCAGLDDTDAPEAMADAFALNNVGSAITALPNITEMVGCDSEAYGHVSVEYAMNQNLFFAGVLGISGPASVRTAATAGWGPAGGANPLPIVVYTGNDQGSCDIQEDTPPDVDCYLWFDNDLFNGSSFGFLNLCTATDPCTHGWDVNAGDSCPNVGSSLRDDWISGNWSGGPNVVNYPDPTYVCRVSGLSSSNWSALEQRIGDDLIFPVNDCTTQVDSSGNTVTCFPSQPPDKYNIIGFMVLNLDEVLDQKSEWEGASGTCDFGPVNMTPTIGDFDLDTLHVSEGCPSYDVLAPPTLSAPGNNPFRCCTLDTHYTFDPNTNVVDWIGNARDNVTIEWDWSAGGPCGVPPNNSSGVCIKVHTVEARFGGTDPGGGADFGLRSIRLCDLPIGSCPEQD
jgi:Putative Flp pilus-assembly TadE/G-like